MKFLSKIAVMLCLSSAARATTLPQPEPSVLLNSAGICQVTLPTIEGRTYFIRMSPDLQNWVYASALTDIVVGDGSDLVVSLDPSSTIEAYVSFDFSDYPTDDPANADFDFDGFSNIVELQNNTSPVQHNAGGGIPPLSDPVLAPGSAFVLRRIIIGEDRDPKRVVEDFQLDAGFNNIAGTGFPGEYEREDPGIVTRFQLFGNPGNVDAVLNLIDRRTDPRPIGPLLTARLPNMTIRESDEQSPPRSNELSFVSDGGTGNLGNISPVDISVAFGIGPPPIGGTDSSREQLEAYLNGVNDGVRSDDRWAIPRLDNQGEIVSFHGVELVDTEVPLRRALEGQGKTVVYDGHSNFGIGPNFVQTTHKIVSNFTGFADQSTDFPASQLKNNAFETDSYHAFRGAGNEVSVDQHVQAVADNLNGVPGAEYPDLATPAQDAALYRLYTEGWAYLVILPSQQPGQAQQPGHVLATRNNYTVPHIGGLRYPNDQGVGSGQTFTVQGAGLRQRHFTTTEDPDAHGDIYSDEHLIISVSNDDIPSNLRYGTYFYNACLTGRDYIESFEHGDFVYTTESCVIKGATRVFVQRTIEGLANSLIVQQMNNQNLGETGNNSYALEEF